MGFEFYDLVWLWNNQSENINPVLDMCLVVSHRFGIPLYYWVMNEKSNVLSHTTVEPQTYDKPRDPNNQQQIRNKSWISGSYTER